MTVNETGLTRYPDMKRELHVAEQWCRAVEAFENNDQGIAILEIGLSGVVRMVRRLLKHVETLRTDVDAIGALTTEEWFELVHVHNEPMSWRRPTALRKLAEIRKRMEPDNEA